MLGRQQKDTTVIFKAKLDASGEHEPTCIALLCCKHIRILYVQCICSYTRLSCLVQLDMELEAHNLRRFQQNLGDNYCVKFPTPLFPFVTKRVLVETFEVCTCSAVWNHSCSRLTLYQLSD